MATYAGNLTVDTTATRISPAESAGGPRGLSLLVRNGGSVTVYLGPSDVSSSTGFPLDAGGDASIDLSGDASEVLYGVTASSSALVYVLAAGV